MFKVSLSLIPLHARRSDHIMKVFQIFHHVRLLGLTFLLCNVLPFSTAFSSETATKLRRSSVFQSKSFSESHKIVGPHFAASSDDVCTVQILMSDTGGGHRASANALRDAFDVLYPGKFQCDIVDIYTDYGPFWPYNDYVGLYKLMAQYDFLWDVFYSFGETELGLALNEFMLETFCFEPFKQCMSRPSGDTGKRADMVVSVHPLCQDIPLKILSELDSDGKSRAPEDRKTPFVTVVTDLGGAHKTWFSPRVDKCFVPSDVLNQKAQSRGLDPSQIVQCGLPIRKGFWAKGETKSQQSPKNNWMQMFEGKSKPIKIESKKIFLRQELDLDESLPTVLMVGGGDGMGGIVSIAKSLGEKMGQSSESPAYQMVVVCGNNKQAKESLSGQNWGLGVKVRILGFVNNMDEWMNASDALVTKAGPGTIAEASICGLPCMLFAYLPGQEEGNVPFVEDAGFGKYSGDPQVIADTVSSWLASPKKMESMKSAALAAARPSATLDIARDLADIAFATKTSKEKVIVRAR